jgi:hypothetical protein
MPDWMRRFESDISDSGEGVEKTMTEDWSGRATDLLLTLRVERSP